jgi:hypothetical protein
MPAGTPANGKFGRCILPAELARKMSPPLLLLCARPLAVVRRWLTERDRHCPLRPPRRPHPWIALILCQRALKEPPSDALALTSAPDEAQHFEEQKAADRLLRLSDARRHLWRLTSW